MAINFPASLDDTTSLPNPTSSSAPSSPSHAGLHDNENAAIIAVESKIGTGSSTPTSGKLLVGTGAGTSGWTISAPTGTIVGTSDTQTLTNKTLTNPTINSPIITNANITTDIISGYTTSNTGTIYGVGITSGVITGANTVNGSSIVASSIPGSAIVGGGIGTNQIAVNGVGANNLATNAITLGYAQITSNFSTTNTSATQVTGLTLTITIPAGSRRIRISGYGKAFYNSASGAASQLSIWDGTVGTGTQIGLALGFQAGGTGATVGWVLATATPSAGSKTYNIAIHSQSAGTATLEASSQYPAFILVEAI